MRAGLDPLRSQSPVFSNCAPADPPTPASYLQTIRPQEKRAPASSRLLERTSSGRLAGAAPGGDDVLAIVPEQKRQGQRRAPAN